MAKTKKENQGFVADITIGVFWKDLGCTLKSIESDKIIVWDDITDQEVKLGIDWPPERIFRALTRLRKGWMERL